MKTTINQTDVLNSDFRHSKWFTSLNRSTNQYEPYLSKKLALQYFASCCDFINDNNVLRYTGKEGGSYRMNITEATYFKQLLKEVEEAKAEAKKYISDLKNEISESNKHPKKYFLFKNCILCVQVWSNSEYTSTDASFIDYIQEHGGDLKHILADLQPIKNEILTLFN